MARYFHKVLKLNEISKETPFACRYRIEVPETLLQSIRDQGQVLPILVTENKIVLSGYRRFAAAQKLELSQVEALCLTEKILPADSFLFSVLSNWNADFSDIDTAFILKRARNEFDFEEVRILDEILPALRLPREKAILEEALNVMRLNPSILELIQSGKLPFRGSKVLSQFSSEDQNTFALIAEQAALTTNQLMKTVEWAGDLLKASKQSMAGFFSRPELQTILDRETDRKSKGEQLFEALRKLRFPKIVEKEKQFQRLSGEIRDEKAVVSLEAPASFEAEGYLLRAKIKNPASLESLRKLLEDKRKELNSLLDIVL
jgi:ParB/RepB/Spo0J family partition protein